MRGRTIEKMHRDRHAFVERFLTERYAMPLETADHASR
jgi:hypothetical protein